MTKDPIDFVIPWVDGSDPAWKAVHDQYTADSSSDNSEARYREWDLFRYWFRAVERYAPWVRTIHFVTFGHVPSWLNLNHPKLHIVNHKDYIPEEYLPTFSSHTIELNLHRIPGLSEHFVYFNDDVYLTAAMKPEDFFQNGKPVDTAVFGVIKNSDTTNYMPYIMLNMMGIINERFPKRDMLRKNFFKWITWKNGKGVLNNLYLLPWGTHTGFRNYHTANPFCKSTFEEVWKEEAHILDQTCRHRFRSREDVNQYLMRYWQLCKGDFVPRKPNSDYFTIGQKSAEEAEKILNDKRYSIVCVNDDPMGFDFEEEKNNLRDIFEKKFAVPSRFEYSGEDGSKA